MLTNRNFSDRISTNLVAFSATVKMEEKEMKNSMKKLLCMLLAIMMVACLAACGDKEEKTGDDAKQENVETKAVDAATADDDEVVAGDDEVVAGDDEVVAGDDEAAEKVAAYIEQGGDVLVDALTESAQGMVDAEITADGTTVVITMAYKSISSDQIGEKKAEMVEMFDEMFEKMDLVAMLQSDVPEVEALRIELSTSDGENIYTRTFK